MWSLSRCNAQECKRIAIRTVVLLTMLTLWTPLAWVLGVNGEEHPLFYTFLLMLVVGVGTLPLATGIVLLWNRVKAQTLFTAIPAYAISLPVVFTVGNLSRPRYFFFFDYENISREEALLQSGLASSIVIVASGLVWNHWLIARIVRLRRGQSQ